MYELLKLGVLFPCKSSLQIWSTGWERGVWRDAELVDPNTHNKKLATYHSWFATPFSRNECMPTIVPRYLHFDLSKHVMRNVSRFRLRAHTLKVRGQRGLKIDLWAEDSQQNTRLLPFLSALMDYLWLAETSQQPISQTTWLKVTPHCNHCNHCNHCMLQQYVSTANTFPFCSHLFLRIFQQPNPFCCNRSTTNLFMISYLSRTIDFFFFFLSLWMYLWLAETSQQPIS